MMEITNELAFPCQSLERLSFKNATVVVGEIIKELAPKDKKAAADKSTLIQGLLIEFLHQ
jgi:hypothetical protein